MDVQVRPDVATAESSAESGRRRYRAFISYGHHDKAIATRLHRQLESYRVPSRLRGTQGTFGPLPTRAAPIFLDREDLASADELGASIRAALVDSDALIVVCSRAAARSHWVNNEVLEFKRLGRTHRIYCLIVDGEPGDPTHECFPPALRFELDADGQIGTRPAEPLAADLRPGGDGWPLARLKLLSGLLGVELDVLRRREVHRRNRRMLAITAASVLAMLVTSFLAVQAVIARNDAQRRQKQAEALVGFMLGDLNDKLREVSRQDILEAVDDHAMAYFQSLPVADVTDQTLEQRAKAYVLIGDVRQNQGHLPQALESYQAAVALTQRLAAAQPRNLARQLAYASDLMFVGMMRWYQGDLAGAQHGFEDVQAILDRARPLAPRDPTLLYQLAGVVNNTAHILEARGRTNAARAQYRHLLDLSTALVAIDATNEQWNSLLGLAHNNLAKMAVLDGELPTAVAEYRADLAIQTAIAHRASRNVAEMEAPLLSQAALGRALALAGDLDGGIAHLRIAQAGAERLHALDKTHMGFAEDAALYAAQLAGLLRQRGQTAEAGKLVARSLAVFDDLVHQDPARADWQLERAEALVEKSVQDHAAGDNAAARAGAHAALAVLDPMLAAKSQDRAIVLAALAARLALAASSDDEAESMHLRQQVLTTVQAQTSGQRDPRLLALRDEALQGLRKAPQATDKTTLAAPSDAIHRP
ncbi:MAG: toll/interleukin-1 receptor domain-containing protein [Proteobacteria bacterium]|nr:toll/interleukin-1 receptor domain-containing protein [Pseudomonadota bacterium]